MIKTFKIISDSEYDFVLKPDSIRTYEELHKLKMRLSAMPTKERLQTAREFKWKLEDFDQDLSLPQYIAEVALLLFKDNPEHKLSTSDNFAPGEINKAERFFFQRANGVLEEA